MHALCVRDAAPGTACEVANAFEHGPASQAIVGTRYFMAPEMVRGEGYSARADVWSAGCLLVELCNRQPPYADLRSVRALLRIASVGAAPLRHPGRFGVSLRDLLAKLTAFRWQERPSAVQALSVRRPPLPVWRSLTPPDSFSFCARASGRRAARSSSPCSRSAPPTRSSHDRPVIVH